MAFQNDTHYFFWGGFLSQWYRCHFTVDGVQYNCAEQYMMAQKALMFEDMEAYEAIMDADNPREQKKIGRKVKNFDGHRWNSRARSIVEMGNIAKFTQNPHLKRQLLETHPLELVEASPYDKIWGVGLAEDDPRIQDPTQWRGDNWLGEGLTRIRNLIWTGIIK